MKKDNFAKTMVSESSVFIAVLLNRFSIKLKSLFAVLFFLALMLRISVINGQSTVSESWTFLNVPDLHNTEIYTKVWPDEWAKDYDSYKAYREANLKRDIARFKYIHDTYQTELVVAPGDCNSGHWFSKSFRKKMRSVEDYKDLSDEEIILTASDLCYSALNEMVTKSGYNQLLIAVGDHEIGDNPWPANQDKVQFIPTFKQGFANAYTLNGPNAESRFTNSIGSVPARPVGTPYEHTSNAVQFKNVLFITLDVFRFDGDDKVLGEEGVVCGDVSGEHLKWLESVLAEAQTISSIDHIVVQAHLPIIYPVRKYASSGMMMTGFSDNVLLKLMRDYKVDLYVAGEVHMNTVTKDPDSDLVQFVGRGNKLTNFSVVKVEPHKLCVRTFDKQGDLIGNLEIDKTGQETAISGSGVLKPIDPHGLQIDWDFDESVARNDYKCSLGGFPGGSNKTAFSIRSEQAVAIPNKGDMGSAYALFADGVEWIPGVKGKGIHIGEESVLFTMCIGPMYADFERTVSCWLRTTAIGRRLILNAGSIWSNNGQFFNLSLNDGKPEIALRPDITLTVSDQSINDGHWHHVAVVVPCRKGRLHNCKIYIDGKSISGLQYQNVDTAINTEQSNWMAIACQSDRFKTNLGESMNMLNYEGDMDEFKIWTKAFSAEDILNIYQEGKKRLESAIGSVSVSEQMP